MNRPRAILFDLDGVLVHSIEAWYLLVRATAAHFGQPDVTRQQFDAGWGQGIDADLETFFVGCRAQDIEDFYARHLLDHAQHIEVTGDAASTLRRLRAADIPAAIITNTPTDLARAILEWASLQHDVALVVGAEPHRRSKPAPDPILDACASLGVSPGDCWMIGDSRFDRLAAEAARCPFVGYRMRTDVSVDTLSEVMDLVDAAPTR